MTIHRPLGHVIPQRVPQPSGTQWRLSRRCRAPFRRFSMCGTHPTRGRPRYPGRPSCGPSFPVTSRDRMRSWNITLWDVQNRFPARSTKLLPLCGSPAGGSDLSIGRRRVSLPQRRSNRFTSVNDFLALMGIKAPQHALSWLAAARDKAIFPNHRVAA